MKLIYTFIFILLVSSGYSQKIFKEKLDGCSPNFKLEDQTVLVEYKKNDSLLILDLIKGAEQKHIQRLKGILALQIIVDSTGSACLISYDKKFNMLRKPFEIVENVNNLTAWPPTKSNPYVGIMLKIYFEKKQIVIQRLGYNRNTGYTMLRKNTYNKPENQED